MNDIEKLINEIVKNNRELQEATDEMLRLQAIINQFYEK